MSLQDLRERWFDTLAAAEQATASALALGLISPEDAVRFRQSIADDRAYVERVVQ